MRIGSDGRMPLTDMSDNVADGIGTWPRAEPCGKGWLQPASSKAAPATGRKRAGNINGPWAAILIYCDRAPGFVGSKCGQMEVPHSKG